MLDNITMELGTMKPGERAMDADHNRRDVLRLAGGSLLSLIVLAIAGPARAFRFDPAEDLPALSRIAAALPTRFTATWSRRWSANWASAFRTNRPGR